MRTPKEAFNEEINSFLKEIPNSLSSQIIRKVEDEYFAYGSYYGKFDSFSHDIGIEIIAQEIFDERSSKTIGYYPYLKYYPGNILEREAELIPKFSKYNKPMKLDKCYEFLAKELVYELTRIPNILEKIQKKNNGL